MSLKKWRQRAKAEAEVEKHEQEIRQQYKMNKIAKEFGQVEVEKLFKPVTKRLDRDLRAPAVETAGPDYAMDEFDRINPFDWGDFRPEAETPPPSPSHEVEEEFPPVEEANLEVSFKMNKIAKEFGPVEAEELFKPVTRRLD